MNKQAFTLIELLVVVLIIGILAAVALPQYQKAVKKTKYMQLIVSGRSLADAEEVYYLANNEYATSMEDLDVQIGDELNVVFSIEHDTKHAALVISKPNSDLPQLIIYLVHHFNGTGNAGKRYCRSAPSNHSLCKSLTGNTGEPWDYPYTDWEFISQ